MESVNSFQPNGNFNKQDEDTFFLGVQNNINKKPKLRSLSLKRRGEKTNVQSEPNLKRVCIESETPHKSEFIAPGLKNLGNTCYINSVLQVLFHLPKFKACVSSLARKVVGLNLGASKTLLSQESFSNYSKLDLIGHLDALFGSMQSCQSGGETVADPSKVYGIMELLNPSFRYGEEHDAHEFLMFLLSLVQDVTKEVGTLLGRKGKASEGDSQLTTSGSSAATTLPQNVSLRPQTPPDAGIDAEKAEDSESTTDFVTDMFHGTMERVTRCMECETESKTSEPFRDLLLHTKRVKEIHPQGPHSGRRENVCSEDEVLSDDEEDDEDGAPTVFVTLKDVEKLTSSNKFQCLVCRHMSEAQRRISFLRCPPILIIHVQRLHQFTNFTSCGMTMSTKMTENMSIPLHLECLEENCLNPTGHRMKLFAVVSHTGYTTSSGHYRAYVDSANVSRGLPASSDPESKDPTNPNSGDIHRLSFTGQQPWNEPLPITDPHLWVELDDHRAKWLSREDLERITGTGYSFNTPNMLFYTRTF